MDSNNNIAVPDSNISVPHPQVTLDQLLTVLTEMLNVLKDMKKLRDSTYCEAIVQKLLENYDNFDKEKLTNILTPTLKVQLGPVFCQGFTKRGHSCKRRPLKGKLFCKDHNYSSLPTAEAKKKKKRETVN